MTYIYTVILFSPIIYLIIKGLIKFAKNSTETIQDEFFTSTNDKFEKSTIELLNFINNKKVYDFYINFELKGSERYFMVKHFSIHNPYRLSISFLYILIPNEIDYELKKKFYIEYSNGNIQDEKLLIILKYILQNFDFIQYKEYRSDTRFTYSLIRKNFRKSKDYEAYTFELFKVIENYYNIFILHESIKYSYQEKFLQLIIRNEWDFSRINVPLDWRSY